MNKIRSLIKKVIIDYKEFQQLHKPIPDGKIENTSIK